ARNVQAPFTLAPDALATSPRAPMFHPVSARTTIGSGETRIELIPVRGETGERMMLAWLPGAKALYSTDLIQHAGPRPAAMFFRPMRPAEVEAAARGGKLEGIDRVFGMHLTPTPWATVLAAIAEARTGAAAPPSTDVPVSAGAKQILGRAIDAMGGEARL